jgi:hypothetical protein
MKIDQAILAAALEGLEAQRARIEEQIAGIRAMLGGAKRTRGPKPASGLDDWEAPMEAVAPKKKPRRKMSAKARKAIAAAQKKRWEAYHAAQK